MFGSWGQIVLMFGTSCNTKTDVSVLSGCYEDSVTKHTKIQDSAPCPALSDLCVQSVRQEGVEVRLPLRIHAGHTWVLGSKQNGWYLFPQQLILISLLKGVEMDSECETTLGRVKAEVSSLWEGQEAGIPGGVTARFSVRHGGCCALYKYFPPIAQIVSSLWTLSLTREEAVQTSFICLILLGLLGAYPKANA